MIKTTVRRLCGLLLALVACLPGNGGEVAAPSAADLARAAAAQPVSAFFGLPNLGQPALSPDGSKIAFLYPLEGRMALGVFDRSTKEARMVVRGRDESIASFRWKGNDHLVFLADFEGNESYFVGSTDLSGKKILRIAESRGTFGGSAAFVVISDWLAGDPNHIAVGGWIGSDWGTRLVKLDITDASRQSLFMEPRDEPRVDYGDYVLDGRGQVRFAGVFRQKEVQLVYRADNQDKFVEVRRDRLDGDGREWRKIAASADGRKIFVVSYTDRDRGALHRFDPGTRRLGPPLFVPPEGEINSLLWNADHTDLAGVLYEDERVRYHWFDEGEARLRAKVEASFPGLEISLTSQSLDGQVRLVRVGSDREAGVYFVLDQKAGKLEQFKRVRDGVDPRLMRPMQAVVLPARDGLELHGYLTMPFATDHGPPPLVVYPHGGPFRARESWGDDPEDRERVVRAPLYGGPFYVRDTWGFDPEVQFLASRGYAVLQINYRGSGGYGVKFLQAGRRQWGRAMQDDLTDGVKWAIAQGFADPGRVAIYGAGYGGFAAMAGATLTPELYRCAVNYVGVIDLELIDRGWGYGASIREDDFDYRAEWVGVTADYRDASNPMRFVDRIRVPTLHAYGRNDPRVPYDHWERLEARLKKFGKPYESMIVKRAGHGFHSEKDAIAFHETLEKFLAKNLAPPPR